MKPRLFLCLLLTLQSIPGCKSTPPQVAGKWHAAGQLTATYSTTLSPKPRTQSAPADITLVLMQTRNAVQGEASVILFKDSAYRIPIRTGVVNLNGTVNLEGDSNSMLSKAHFSFDGKTADGKMTGTVGFGFSNVGGAVDSKGEMAFALAQ